MRKKQFLSFFLVAALMLTSCVAQDAPPEKELHEGSIIQEYGYSHELTSIDVLSEELVFSGQPITFDYTFENGNTAANFGMLLFLNGVLQPFDLDNSGQDDHIKYMQIEANSEKSISVSFTPITGSTGDRLPLHIVVIFDAMKTIETPTIALPFYESISQTCPATVSFNVDAPSSEHHFVSSSLKMVNETYTTMDEAPTSSSLDIVGISTVEEIMSSSIRPGVSFDIALLPNRETETAYNIYAFLNHTPLMWMNDAYLTKSILPNHRCLLNIVIDDVPENATTSENNEIFFLAVPLHDSSVKANVTAVKTKTVTFENP